MSILSALFSNQISVEQALKAKDITTGPMKKAIREWFRLYFDTHPTETEDPCQRIPYVVVNKLTKTTFSEYTATAADDFQSGCLTALEKVRKKAMQFALIGGECYLKPVPTRGGFNFVPVRRDCYLILGRNENGEATSIGTAEYTSGGGKYYTLLEKRTVDEVCCVLGYLYKLCPRREFDPDSLVVDWGNGVLYDRDKAWAERKDMVDAGLLKPELAVAWYFNLPCKTQADLEKIRREYMPEIQALTGGD